MLRSGDFGHRVALGAEIRADLVSARLGSNNVFLG